MLVDGSVGPTFSVDPGLELQVNALPPTSQSAGPWWDLQGVVDFDAGIFFGFELGPVQVTIASYHTTLFQTTIPLFHAAEITTTSLPEAPAGSPYSTTLAASGGFSPYSWSLGSGASLPSWLSLSSAGVFSGTPPLSAENTTVSVPVVLSDALGPSQTATLTLQVGPPAPLAVTTTSLPTATTGTSYSSALQATGGITPYAWAITSGTLPAGLSLDASTGVISGTPSATGSSSFTVTLTDAQGTKAQAALSITVAQPAALLTWSAPVSIDPNNGGLGSVSCASASFCTAVDNGGNAFTFNGSTWSSPKSIDPNGYPNSVSCPSASFCAAVDPERALTWNGSTWSAPEYIDSSDGYLQSVSCASASFCAAVDSYGNALTFNGTSWSAPTSIDPNLGDLTSVSCALASFCTAVDNGGNALTFNGSTWSSPEGIDSSQLGPVELTSVSCPSASFCAAVDYDGNAVIGRS